MDSLTVFWRSAGAADDIEHVEFSCCRECFDWITGGDGYLCDLSPRSGVAENVHGVLVKWGHSFLVATTRKDIVGDRKSAVFFVYDSCRVEVSSRCKKKASFLEVAVAPISGHTSSPHRMHVATDEK